MSGTRLRLGIVGCGAVVEHYHLPAIVHHARVSLEALVDTSPERLYALAATTGVRATTDYRQLEGLVDAAIVAVPNDLHATIAIDLVRAGVHVLVEKPLAPTVVECDAMIQAAADSGALLAVGHDFRFAPAIRLVKGLLETDSLGEIRGFDLRHGTESRWPLATGYLFDRGRAGGGVLLDQGAHLLDHLLWWLGPCSVETYRDDAQGGVEGDADILLRTESGAHGIVELSRTRTLRNTCRIDGERGSVDVGLFEPLARVALRLGGEGPALEGLVGDEKFARRPYRALFELQLDDFAEAIASGREPSVPGREGRRSVALIEQCYAARQPLEHPWDYPRAYEVVR